MMAIATQGNPGAACGCYTCRTRALADPTGASQPKPLGTVREPSADASPNCADVRDKKREFFSGVRQVEGKRTLKPQVWKLFLKTALSVGSCKETPSFFSRDCSATCVHNYSNPSNSGGKISTDHQQESIRSVYVVL